MWRIIGAMQRVIECNYLRIFGPIEDKKKWICRENVWKANKNSVFLLNSFLRCNDDIILFGGYFNITKLFGFSLYLRWLFIVRNRRRSNLTFKPNAIISFSIHNKTWLRERSRRKTLNLMKYNARKTAEKTRCFDSWFKWKKWNEKNVFRFSSEKKSFCILLVFRHYLW